MLGDGKRYRVFVTNLLIEFLGQMWSMCGSTEKTRQGMIAIFTLFLLFISSASGVSIKGSISNKFPLNSSTKVLLNGMKIILIHHGQATGNTLSKTRGETNLNSKSVRTDLMSCRLYHWNTCLIE